MAEQKQVVHDQAWFDAAFKTIRTAPVAQAEVELRALIRDVGTAAMTRAMRVWLDVTAKRNAETERLPERAQQRASTARHNRERPWSQRSFAAEHQ